MKSRTGGKPFPEICGDCVQRKQKEILYFGILYFHHCDWFYYSSAYDNLDIFGS